MSQDNFGLVIDALWDTIESRKQDACAQSSESYTASLLTAHPDKLLKKIAEESAEVIMASKDLDAALATQTEGESPYGTARDHVTYEVCDLIYHLMVLGARYDISPDDLGEELRRRSSLPQD
jgi:phosphoribosyl-ATP pyrophosphohydrolase